jgi:hypothetical protein
VSHRCAVAIAAESPSGPIHFESAASDARDPANGDWIGRLLFFSESLLLLQCSDFFAGRSMRIESVIPGAIRP